MSETAAAHSRALVNNDFWSGLLSPAWAARLAWAVAGVGVLLRLVVWGQARSVYLDEVNLLRNFVERDYAGLFQPLSYEQYAPPLFSVLMKAVVQAFGTGELAIRLVPLLAGCAMLLLFRGLALRWLPPLWAVLAVAFLAFGSLFIDYATICKQYSTDGLAAVGLVVLATRQLRAATFGPRAALGWALGGAALVWVSMPAVFVLAGVGVALAWHYRTQLRGPVSLRLLGVGATWALSFLVYFKLLLQADAQSDYLQNFHHDAFLAFPPRSGAQWQLLGSQLGGLVDKAFGKTALALAVAAVGAAVGVGQLLRRPSVRTWLLLVPLVACLAASALHYYSLIARLVLFMLPLLLLVLFIGFGVASRWRWLGGVLLVGTVLTLANQQRLKHFVVPFQADYADARAGLAYVAQHQQPGEPVFIAHSLAPVAYYYLHLHPRPLALRNVVVVQYRPTAGGDAELLPPQLLSMAAAGQPRIWVVYDQPLPWLREWAASHGTVTQLLDYHRGYAFRVALR